jgi:hypothetical protein
VFEPPIGQPEQKRCRKGNLRTGFEGRVDEADHDMLQVDGAADTHFDLCAPFGGGSTCDLEYRGRRPAHLGFLDCFVGLSISVSLWNTTMFKGSVHII